MTAPRQPPGEQEPSYKRKIAIIGSLVAIATFVFTVVNHRLDDQRDERVFESDLTSQMATASSDVISTSRSIAGSLFTDAPGKEERKVEQREYLRIRELWMAESTELDVKLFAYYQEDEELRRHWDRYSSAVAGFIRLSSNAKPRREFVNALRSLIDPDGAQTVPNLRVLEGSSTDRGFATVYFEVAELLTGQLEQLAKRVVNATPEGFGDWVPNV